MNEILVLTVGMSTAPLINCIRSRRPERVVFLCSEGTRSKVDEVLDAVPIPNSRINSGRNNVMGMAKTLLTTGSRTFVAKRERVIA